MPPTPMSASASSTARRNGLTTPSPPSSRRGTAAPDRAGQLSYLLAQVCDEAGQPKQALTHLDAYVRTQPLSIEPYELKVNLLRRLKQPQAIVPGLEEASGRDRFNNALHLLLARELGLAKEVKKAEFIYQRIAEDAPSRRALSRPIQSLQETKAPLA